MPTNCWNTESAIPTQTIGFSPKVLPRRVPVRAACWSLSIELRMSRIARSASSAGHNR